MGSSGNGERVRSRLTTWPQHRPEERESKAWPPFGRRTARVAFWFGLSLSLCSDALAVAFLSGGELLLGASQVGIALSSGVMVVLYGRVLVTDDSVELGGSDGA